MIVETVDDRHSRHAEHIVADSLKFDSIDQQQQEAFKSILFVVNQQREATEASQGTSVEVYVDCVRQGQISLQSRSIESLLFGAATTHEKHHSTPLQVVSFYTYLSSLRTLVIINRLKDKSS